MNNTNTYTNEEPSSSNIKVETPLSPPSFNYIQQINTHNPIWKIATHNVRGFTTNTIKQQAWFEFCKSQNWDIIITTETNGTENDSKNWKHKSYKSYWTHSESQTIGHGIGISLTPALAHRIFKITTFPGRVLVTDLAFPHNRKLHIIGIYFPAHNSNHEKRDTTQFIQQKIKEATDKGYHIILAGDLNAISNPSLDKNSPSKSYTSIKPSAPHIDFLIQHGFIDTYREHNFSRQQYT
jgi:exonuclease III